MSLDPDTLRAARAANVLSDPDEARNTMIAEIHRSAYQRGKELGLSRDIVRMILLVNDHLPVP